MVRCTHCSNLGSATRPYRDIESEPFVVLRTGCLRDPIVVLRVHEKAPLTVVRVAALVALKAIASRLYGNAYYIQIDSEEEHWNASVRKLWVNQPESNEKVV